MSAKVPGPEDTQPIGNILQFAPRDVNDRWLKEHMGLYPKIREMGYKPVSFHRAMLGRSTITIGSRRYFTWRRPLWVAFVANGYGMSLEVPGFRSWAALEKNPKPYVDRALESWRDYMKAIRMESSV